MSTAAFNQRLEQYTIKRPGEVLVVNAAIAHEPDQVLIFRGFSSSLMRPTASDPDVPVLPDEAIIQSIDRLRSPYNPDQPDYIQQGLTLDAVTQLLDEVGV
jgi:hypothetical protein